MSTPASQYLSKEYEDHTDCTFNNLVNWHKSQRDITPPSAREHGSTELAWRISVKSLKTAVARRNQHDFLYNSLRAQTWLHEFTHHNLVSNPSQPSKFTCLLWQILRAVLTFHPSSTHYQTMLIRFLWSKTPDASAALANCYGASTPGHDKDGGYNGEFGTAISADNYAMFALSVYFQEILSRQAPYEPEDPRYKQSPDVWLSQYQIASVSSLDDDPDMYNSSTETITPSVSPTFTDLVSPLTRSDAIGNINAFCQDNFKWDFQIVPPISYGNGKTPAGNNKAMQFDNSVSSTDRIVKNGFWLNVVFYDRFGIGSMPFTQGSTSGEKIASCTNPSMAILDCCQTDT
ncbi:uncharacterized protein PAC_14302 [Phialocephala subalpina]|uniref:Uncharacterized protein n=1 Tax=Phialocephala subalpina TaxID=576137 RepID=A0A1L7XHA1_9HELO|nr:uncharacterized protein PAC_14302 [Phialocephala subalpina]